MDLQFVKLVNQAREWMYQNRRRLATGAVGLLAGLLAWHVIFGANGIAVYEHKRAQYQQLDQQIQDLQTENTKLSQDVKDLKNDPKAIEKEAREQLRYARPGEVVYVMPEAKADHPANASAKK